MSSVINTAKQSKDGNSIDSNPPDGSLDIPEQLESGVVKQSESQSVSKNLESGTNPGKQLESGLFSPDMDEKPGSVCDNKSESVCDEQLESGRSEQLESGCDDNIKTEDGSFGHDFDNTSLLDEFNRLFEGEEPDPVNSKTHPEELKKEVGHLKTRVENLETKVDQTIPTTLGPPLSPPIVNSHHHPPPVTPPDKSTQDDTFNIMTVM